MKTVAFCTLGCRVNQYESVSLAETLQSMGYKIVDFKAKADLYVINTCAVTAESARKSAQDVRRAAASGGNVAVLGCASQLAPERFSEIEGVKFVGGCGKKGELIDFVGSDFAGDVIRVGEVPRTFEKLEIGVCPTELFSSCRAYIKIQDGCSCRCTYCTIPFARGRSRSRPLDEITAEVERLARVGYKEIELTGIETSAYSGAPLSELIKKAGSVDGIMRVRLGSLSPLCVTDEFIQAIKETETFMPHLHISVQSASDRVLRAMRRPYTADDLHRILDTLRDKLPEFCVSVDLICGFPGESEEDFAATLDLVEEYRFSHVHAFPYSEREGTEAAQMAGKIPMAERRKRNERLISLSDRIRDELLSERIGKTVLVLVEKLRGGRATGHTEDYFECNFDYCGKLRVGDIVPVLVQSQSGAALVGREEKL